MPSASASGPRGGHGKLLKQFGIPGRSLVLGTYPFFRSERRPKAGASRKNGVLSA